MSHHCQTGAHAGAAGAPRPQVALADVLRVGLRATEFAGRTAHELKVLNALLACGTEALGGHRYRCEDCGREHFVPHSCRNRHCPRCQRHLAEAWLERERGNLLPVPYYHVVLTLPHVLNPLIRQNRAALYRLLFASASATLLEFGRNRFDGQIGITAVLHTWGQNLGDHYHLQCLVTAGALQDDCKGFKLGSARYLFPVTELSKVFRAKFRDGLWQLQADGALCLEGQLDGLKQPRAFAALMRSALAKDWAVYAKRPFAGPEQVLAYLSRYTHRVAISSGRIVSLDHAAQTATFRYKDYADHHRQKQMTLDAAEFLRRFCLHILPRGLVKIRHYGLYGNHQRKAKLAAARAALERNPLAVKIESSAQPSSSTTSLAPLKCPHCGSLRQQFLARIQPIRLDCLLLREKSRKAFCDSS